MLPTEDLFVYAYVLVDDAISSGAIAIASRPGMAPACTDAELLAIALVRHLLGRRSEAGFLAQRPARRRSDGDRPSARRGCLIIRQKLIDQVTVWATPG